MRKTDYKDVLSAQEFEMEVDASKKSVTRRSSGINRCEIGHRE